MKITIYYYRICHMKFKKMESTPDFQKIEVEILKFWKENQIFQKSLSNRKDSDKYVFYDGPPFATGLPHYGHLTQGTIKDIIPRYHTMKGKYVERRFGWDCHGLPVEYELEKIKGIKNKKEIEDMGIDIFNESCRNIVQKYVKEWKIFVERMGRWIDMENDYKTMDLPFMESVWYVFKTLYDKGLIYEGYKSIHICPRCATPLSNTEVQMGYKDLEEASVIVKFKLEDEDKYMLAWTTTPWTLPANVLLAVSKNIHYAEVEHNGEIYIIAKSRIEYIFENLEYKVIKDININDYIGRKYTPMFDITKLKDIDNKRGWFIAEADFVEENEGTGIVHIAPAFGEEDMLVGKKLEAPIIRHIDIQGKFGEYPMMEWAAGEARLLNKDIIEFLQNKNIILKVLKIVHSYPHCWRCDTPLLNYSMESWFVNVQKIKSETLKNNEEIYWFPKHLKEGRFKNGLENAPDWAISRNRYWGTPIPVWKCNSCSNIKVIGSKKELEELTSKENITDLHRHFIDKLEIKCDKCEKGTMNRVPEVLDCWFESGSMPYAQKHYPFENKEEFEKNFPADFIAEAIDQTRGWFYVLHTISTALHGTPAFKNVIVTGLVLAADGQKMSKSKKNYTDPMDIINTYGAEALRIYLIRSPLVKGEDLMFKNEGLRDVVKDILVPLYNIVKYFTIYANLFNFEETKEESGHLLDRWISSKTENFVIHLDEYLQAYDLMGATSMIQPYIQTLSTEYIRRSRNRFVNGDKNALSTLYKVLLKFTISTAPLIPFISEYIYKELNGKKESIHLEDYPKTSNNVYNKELEEMMEIAQSAITEIQNIRVENSIKLKQPVKEVFVKYDKIDKSKIKEDILSIIKEEVNARKISTTVSKQFKSKDNIHGSIGVDTTIDDDILQDTTKREIIRAIQAIRKESGYNIEDIVECTISTTSNDIRVVVEKFQNDITKTTKLKSLKISDNTGKRVVINNQEATISIK